MDFKSLDLVHLLKTDGDPTAGKPCLKKTPKCTVSKRAKTKKLKCCYVSTSEGKSEATITTPTGWSTQGPTCADVY